MSTQTTPYPTECIAVPGSDSIIDHIHPGTGKGWYSGKTIEELQAEERGAIRMTIDEFCERKALRQDVPVQWENITEERYYDLMECLPPAAYADNGFLVGEPWDHHAGTGKPRYQACRIVNDKYQASSRPMTKLEFKGGIA